MRLPPQGGLPPADAVAGGVVEIACDESGFSGSNLLHPATPVITHASVDLSVGEAVELIATLRSGFGRSLSELKSGRFLRGPEAGEALELFLAALSGRAHVHLVDKEYFLVTRIVDMFLVEPSYAAGTRLTQDQRPPALALYRVGRSAGRDWDVFLAAFVELVRVKRRRQPDRQAVERFFRARDVLVRDGRRGSGVAVGRAGDGRLPRRSASSGRRPPGRGGPAVTGDRRRRPASAVSLPASSVMNGRGQRGGGTR